MNASLNICPMNLQNPKEGNMRKLGGPVKYFKYNECNEGDVLITKGKYIESFDGRYGVQHKFIETDSKEEKVLNSSGQLNYLVDTYLEPGAITKVVYAGKVTLDKGAMKGKQAHNFEVFIDDDAPTTKLDVNEAPQTSMDLDDLE